MVLDGAQLLNDPSRLLSLIYLLPLFKHKNAHQNANCKAKNKYFAGLHQQEN
jgi:hypothetical protein